MERREFLAVAACEALVAAELPIGEGRDAGDHIVLYYQQVEGRWAVINAAKATPGDLLLSVSVLTRNNKISRMSYIKVVAEPLVPRGKRYVVADVLIATNWVDTEVFDKTKQLIATDDFAFTHEDVVRITPTVRWECEVELHHQPKQKWRLTSTDAGDLAKRLDRGDQIVVHCFAQFEANVDARQHSMPEAEFAGIEAFMGFANAGS